MRTGLKKEHTSVEYEIFHPLERREQLVREEEDEDATYLKPKKVKKEREFASLFLIFRRFCFWNVHVSVYLISMAWRLFRKVSIESRAQKLRLFLQSGGLASLKLGQQLSIRVDALPSVYCKELEKLLDQIPPLLLQTTLYILEESYGRRLDEIFQAFDPEPIGSASIACVYQAYLMNGKQVAVKVVRPHLKQHVDADLKIMIFFAKVAEWLGVIREGSASRFMHELKVMLLEELDLRIEARYTEILHRDVKKMDFKKITAPKLYHELCNERVMVSEFCHGVFLSESLIAKEASDRKKLKKLLHQGYDLKKIADTLAQFFYWEIFEADFFHADPHAANIIVRPNNKLTLIDFGSCGTLSGRFRRKVQDSFETMLTGDFAAMVRNSLTLSEPIPPIDTKAFIDSLVPHVTDWYFSVRSKRTHWTQKTTGSMYLKGVRELGNFGINASAEMVRYIRATMLHDTIIFRLYEEYEPLEAYQKFVRKNTKRKAEQIIKNRKKNKSRGQALQKLEHLTIEMPL